MLFGSDLRLTSVHGAVVDCGHSAEPKSPQEQPARNRSISTRSKWNLSTLFKLRHHWTAQWNPEAAPNSHIGVAHIHHDLRIFAKWPFIVMKVKAEQVAAI